MLINLASFPISQENLLVDSDFCIFPLFAETKDEKEEFTSRKGPPQKKIKIKIVDTNKEEYCQKLCICWLPIKYKNLFKLEDDPICNGILID